MTDPDFDTQLAEALMSPGAPRGDLAQAVMRRVAHGDRARRVILGGAVLAGLTVAVAAAQVARWIAPDLWTSLPTIGEPGPFALAAAGVIAALLAAGVAALREA